MYGYFFLGDRQVDDSSLVCGGVCQKYSINLLTKTAVIKVRKHTIGSTFNALLRGTTAVISAAGETAETIETGARTMSGMALRNEKVVNINGNIKLLDRMKELAAAAKKADLSDKDKKRLKDLGLDI